MLKPKRIFVVADFNDESPKSIRMQQRMWTKGLVRLGHDVQRFSFRNIMMQCSPFPSKRIARLFGKRKANSLLVEQVVRYHPDIIFVLSMKYLDAESVAAMRGAVAMVLNEYCGELEDLFEIDKEIVTFEFGNVEELRDKLSWYITHDSERERVARAGYERGRKQHTFSACVKQIFNIVREKL